jgi:hypothetical protein
MQPPILLVVAFEVAICARIFSAVCDIVLPRRRSRKENQVLRVRPNGSRCAIVTKAVRGRDPPPEFLRR